MADHDSRLFLEWRPFFIRCEVRPFVLFAILREAERTAQLVGQRRPAEQPGLFEPVEIGEVAQAWQSRQSEERRQ